MEVIFSAENTTFEHELRSRPGCFITYLTGQAAKLNPYKNWPEIVLRWHGPIIVTNCKNYADCPYLPFIYQKVRSLLLPFSFSSIPFNVSFLFSLHAQILSIAF